MGFFSREKEIVPGYWSKPDKDGWYSLPNGNKVKPNFNIPVEERRFFGYSSSSSNNAKKCNHEYYILFNSFGAQKRRCRKCSDIDPNYYIPKYYDK